MTTAPRRPRWAIAGACVVVAGAAVALHAALRFEPPPRVWVGLRETESGIRGFADLFDAPGGRPVPYVCADWSDTYMNVLETRTGRVSGEIRRLFGMQLRSWGYLAADDVVTRGDVKWFPYDRDPSAE